MNNCTAITVSFHAPDALALMWESFKYHHPAFKGRWLVFCNSGGDCEARDYAKAHADVVLEGDNTMSHGERISQLCDLVDSDYVLHLDNDLEFHAPVLDKLRAPFEDPKIYCSCLTRLYYPHYQTWKPPHKWEHDYPYGDFDVWQMRWKGCWSPNIALGMMRMDVIRRIHELGIGFGYYNSDQRRHWYETGGMAFLFAKAMGYEVAEIPELWNHVTHYGSLSTLWAGGKDNPVVQERYNRVTRRLQEFRNETQLAVGCI